MLPMIDVGHDIFGGGPLASKLVGDHHPWISAIRLHQLFKEALGCPPVAALLHQDIEHVTLLIHGAPEIKSLAVDLDHSLIKKPLVARPWPVSPDDISEQRAEPLLALMDSLMTDVDAAIGKDVLDIAKAERETTIPAHGVADDLARKTVTFEGVT